MSNLMVMNNNVNLIVVIDKQYNNQDQKKHKYNLIPSRNKIFVSSYINLNIVDESIKQNIQFSYFYYPIDPAQIQELKNDRGESVRFLKPVSVN